MSMITRVIATYAGFLLVEKYWFLGLSYEFLSNDKKYLKQERDDLREVNMCRDSIGLFTSSITEYYGFN